MKNDKKTIFIVDDAKSNLEVYSSALADTYTVFTLDSALRLLKMLERVIPDLILLDVEMPDMDGYEALAKIKSDERFKNIPVIFISAHVGATKETRGMELGAVDYIKKPVMIPILVRRIEKHIKG